MRGFVVLVDDAMVHDLERLLAGQEVTKWWEICLAGPEAMAEPSSPKLPIKKEAPKFAEDSVPYQLASRLLRMIRERDPKYRQPNLQSWAADIDKLICIDKRTPKEVAEVMAWSQRDSFWSPNILSAAKLREKFSALLLKMPRQAAEREEGPNGVVF